MDTLSISNKANAIDMVKVHKGRVESNLIRKSRFLVDRGGEFYGKCGEIGQHKCSFSNYLLEYRILWLLYHVCFS